MKPSKTIIYYINRVYAKNLTTTSGGNLSVMDKDGNIWITPSGKDKGTLKEEDICCVTPDGQVIGEYKPSIELPFHTLIYKLRPDVKAVLHVHSPMLVTYSLFNIAPKTDITAHSYLTCGKVGLSRYDIPGSIELGRQIADVIKEGHDVVMMENHGVVAIAKDMSEAYNRLETLENTADIFVKAAMLKKKVKTLAVKDIRPVGKRVPYEYIERDAVSEKEKELREEICAFAKRCYVHGFFTVASGVISARLSEDTFLITPHKYDRFTLKPSDVVKVTQGKCEKGKKASADYALHRDIYSRKKYVNSIFVSDAPNIMTYAVTGAEIDSRTIPESYINMRDITRIPFGGDRGNTDELIDSFSPASPIALVENTALIATGETIVKAFDRVEVSEVTAKTLLLATPLGEPTKISDFEIEKIDKAFDLPKK